MFFSHIPASRRNFLIAAGIMAVIVILRLPSLFIEVLDVDEAIYALFSRIWIEGGIPYVNCVETKPLGIYFFYALIFRLVGVYNIIAVHAATIIVVGLTSYVIYLITMMLQTRRAAWWAALFYVIFSTTYIPKVIATTIEPIMLLPVSLQFYYWLRFEREQRVKFAYFSGLAFSAACLFKYQAGINLIVMLFYLGIIHPLFIKNINWRGHWKGSLKFIIGAIPLPVIMIVYLAYKGALGGFYFWNIHGSINYIQGGSSTIHLFHQILTRILPFVASTALLWLLFARRTATLARILFGFSKRSPRGMQEWLILLWFFLTIIPVATGKRYYGHYFLLLLPSMSILAAPVIEKIWHENSAKWKKVFVLFWIIVPAVGFSVPRYFLSDVNKTFHEDNQEDYRPLANYISENTDPSDRIVVWGYGPLVYWYSGRLPAIRFFWSDVLTGRIPGLKQKPMPDTSIFAVPESWQMFWDDIDKNRPKYFVDAALPHLHDYGDYPITLYPKVMEYLKQHYREEIKINGATFYRRID